VKPEVETAILADRVRHTLGNRPVTERRMFGGLTFLLSGHMLCCVSQKGLMARVGTAAEPAALAKPHATPCLGSGRRMAGFILVEPRGVASAGDLADWLSLALAYVEHLPPKKSKPAHRRGTVVSIKLQRT
jgi:TfoX/Sxy family transcriptional regulator of competence genes